MKSIGFRGYVSLEIIRGKNLPEDLLKETGVAAEATDRPSLTTGLPFWTTREEKNMGYPSCRWLVGVAALCWLSGLAARAETVLWDFEDDADFRAWHYERRDKSVPVKELSRAERFATSGRCSMRFTSPAWKQGMTQWPAFEAAPPVRDWSGYDRLAFDVTNATDADQKLFLFISDSKIPTRSGRLEQTVLAPSSFTRVVIPLAGLKGKKVSPADIHVLHFFTERPSRDMEVYVDRLVLLRPGERVPPVQPTFLKEFAVLQQGRVELLRRQLDEAGDRLRRSAAGMEEVAAWVNASLAELEREVNALADRAARADAALVEDQPGLRGLQERLDRLEGLVGLRCGFARVRPAVQARGTPRTDVVVGFATSMDKVLPRAAPPLLTIADKTEIHLARNEKEGFQVVVVPCERNVAGVRVRVTDLQTAEGARFAAANVDTAVIGYVQTRHTPPYGSSHIGWWPDPILNFQTTADIARGDAQAFWVRLRAPKDQPAGIYRGKLEVDIDGSTAFAFNLTVRVFSFAVPGSSPLPLAVTFWPMFYEPNEGGGYREGESRDPAWKAHKAAWADFLADYYLSYDSLYAFATWSPDFEILQRIHGQRRLGRFNLGYFEACGESPADIDKWRQRTIDVIRPRYEQAKRLGLLDHAYIYGCDEHPVGRFPAVQRAAELLKKEFPDVPVMTTTYDHSFGTKSVLRSIDAFCPLTPRLDPKLASQVRAAGKQVWWYICCGPHHPHANLFIEYPAIEGRLLMGAMTTRYRPDGFLYYEISIWNSGPITSGPFTAWDPRSWTTYHGDGSWTCLGPGSTPLPTIRLENFRDGLEDYAYARTLEATVAKIESSPQLAADRAEWLKKAKRLLAVPDEVVTSLVLYTRDPAVLYSYRDSLAEAIETAGIEAVSLEAVGSTRSSTHTIRPAAAPSR